MKLSIEGLLIALLRELLSVLARREYRILRATGGSLGKGFGSQSSCCGAMPKATVGILVSVDSMAIPSAGSSPPSVFGLLLFTVKGVATLASGLVLAGRGLSAALLTSRFLLCETGRSATSAVEASLSWPGGMEKVSSLSAIPTI